MSCIVKYTGECYKSGKHTKSYAQIRLERLYILVLVELLYNRDVVFSLEDPATLSCMKGRAHLGALSQLISAEGFFEAESTINQTQFPVTPKPGSLPLSSLVGHDVRSGLAPSRVALVAHQTRSAIEARWIIVLCRVRLDAELLLLVLVVAAMRFRVIVSIS